MRVVGRLVAIGCAALAVSPVVHPSHARAAGSPADGEQSGPAILLRGCAGIALFGTHLCAGAGGGWSCSTMQAGVLASVSRIRTGDIVLGPGERYSLIHAVEASGWFVQRASPRSRWGVGALAGLGARRFTFSNFDEVQRRNGLSWSAAAGPGYGPAFLMLGLAGPGETFTGSAGTIFPRPVTAHLSLNVLWDILSSTRL